MICEEIVYVPQAASALTFTGSGLTYDDSPLVLPAPGAPLLLANSTTATLPPDAGTFVFAAAAGVWHPCLVGRARFAVSPGLGKQLLT